MDRLYQISLFIIIIGALNWGVFSFTSFDVFGQIAGGIDAPFARVINGIIGLAAIVFLSIMLHRLQKKNRIPFVEAEDH